MVDKTERFATSSEQATTRVALGVDVGHKNYGFALSYEGLVVPIMSCKVHNGVLPMSVLDCLLAKYNITDLVIGYNEHILATFYTHHLSLNLAKCCRIRFINVKIHLVDESYTSYQAEVGAKLGQRVDHIAAKFILINWLKSVHNIG